MVSWGKKTRSRIKVGEKKKKREKSCVRCYRDEKCTVAATCSTEKAKPCPGHPLLGCKSSSAVARTDRGRGWEDNASESSRAQAAVLGSQESHCPAVSETQGRVQESDHLTGAFYLDISDRLHQILAEASQSWQESSSLNPFGQAGAACTLLCSYGKSTYFSQRML